MSVENVASHNPGAKIVTEQENDNEQMTESTEQEQLDNASEKQDAPVEEVE